MTKLLESLEPRRLMTTFTVTNLADSGPGSLRWAIEQADLTVNHDVVEFSVPGSGGGISLQSSLTIHQPITIDATTQPGYAGVPLIRLNDGNNVGYGIYLDAMYSTISGLSITGFGGPASAADGRGIIITKSVATIEKCYIGLRPDGGATGNENDGVYIGENADQTVIRNNVISGNGGNGVYVEVGADNVDIRGNIIGLDPSGTAARPNLLDGVRNAGAIGLEVGGYTDADRNIISGNGKNGVYFANLLSKGYVLGNYIGTSKGGNALIANTDYGVWLQATDGVFVGAETTPNRFGGDGVMVRGYGINNHITGNYFGVGVSPIFDVGGSVGVDVDAGNNNFVYKNIVGRLDTGIRVTNTGNRVMNNYVGVMPNGYAVPNTLGITTQGSNNEITDNVVANNTNFGVWVVSGSGHTVLNSTYNNGQSIWVSTGANDSIGSPVVQTISEMADGKYAVNFKIAEAMGTYRLSVYQSDSPGNAATGDTKELVQSFTVVSGGAAIYPTFNVDGLADGKYVSATLTQQMPGGSLYSTGEPSVAKPITGSPAVYGSTFEFESKLAWSFQFSQDVGASLQPSDVTITNTDTLQAFVPNNVTWDAGTRTAKFARNGTLPDGYYQARLNANSVSGPGGTNKKSSFHAFFVLAGDADRNGHVDFDDLLTLAQNYGKQTKTWSQGNFNYDAQGKVDFDDLLMLAQRYGTSLFSSAPVVSSASRKTSSASEIIV